METYDLTVRAGNSGTVQNALGLVVNLIVGTDPLDLSGQTVIWRVTQGGTQVLRKDTSTGITLTNGTDLAGAASAVPNLVTVPITVAESRTLEAAGAGLTYDLEVRTGSDQRTYLSGNVFVEAGANDD